MTEVVTLEQAKARLGIASDHRDVELRDLIPAARGLVEDYSGRILSRRTISKGFAIFPPGPLVLHIAPVHAVLELKYYDAAGLQQTFEGTRVFAEEYSARLWPAAAGNWPAAGWPGGVTVKVDAGYDSGSADPDMRPPAELVQAVLLLVGHWFENHEASVVGTSAVELPFGVRALCAPFRAPGLT